MVLRPVINARDVAVQLTIQSIRLSSGKSLVQLDAFDSF